MPECERRKFLKIDLKELVSQHEIELTKYESAMDKDPPPDIYNFKQLLSIEEEIYKRVRTHKYEESDPAYSRLNLLMRRHLKL